ncbi:DotU/TssL family secretion system protein [Pseudomonas sp. KNUC1026]|uniref:DotU/TssL family secretion system protein n=1 Tax=Pseudomonas sp. KNUC1026 TaxID=2893890 RepID=UPI001F32CBDC|nr:DotU/TssL family secretion system protein [Pseudomonas sp. KNUC1026]UFH51056.1 DotU/TssL family secretion system protein [Pseudomonas sp. KNUC1026]
MTGATLKAHCMADIDLLLHSTWLLACELRHGAAPVDGEQLQRRCREQIESVREALSLESDAQAWAEQVCLVQCAVLDEAVMACTSGTIRERWQVQPLQARYLGHHQAGELLYERMDQALREPATNTVLITLFHRALLLGFEGRHAQGSAPVSNGCRLCRNALWRLSLPSTLGPAPARITWPVRRMLRHPMLHLACAALLVAGAWRLADASLDASLQNLFPGDAP